MRGWPKRTQGCAAALTALVLGLALGLGPRLAIAQTPLESSVKATYLYKFAPFVEWPADVFSASPNKFNLCVIGADPFGPLLDQAVVDQRIGRRLIVVRRLPSAMPDSPCQIAYLGGSSAQSIDEAVRVLRGKPVLTVAEGPEAPGVVDFVIDRGRVRFIVDQDAATQDGLEISSKLLSVALAVKPRKAVGPGS